METKRGKPVLIDSLFTAGGRRRKREKCMQVDRKMKRHEGLILMLGILLFSGEMAVATPITVAISGYVSEISDPLNHLQGTFSVGDIVEGVYVYDSETEPSPPVPAFGNWYDYSESPYGMDLNVGDTRFYTNPENIYFTIRVADNLGGPFDTCYDTIGIYSNYNLSSDTSLAMGLMAWLLYDFSHQVLTNMELPLTAPNLDEWESNELIISEDFSLNPYDNYLIKMQITSAITIPEPGSLVLLAAGGIFIRKKGKWKR